MTIVRRAKLSGSLAVIFGVTAQAVMAAHPLVTEDTGTQGKNKNQLEANTDNARQNGTTTRTAVFTYSRGVRDDLDAIINLPGTLNPQNGLNDAALGLKWRFAERGSVSAGLKTELTLPTGDQNRSLGTGRSGAALTLIGSYDAAPWAFHGNLGITLNRYALQTDRDANRSTVWRASTAVSYAVNDQWRAVADVGISQNTDKASSYRPAFFLAGAIYSPNEVIDLDAGLRFGLGCSTCVNSLDRQFGVGLTWRF